MPIGRELTKYDYDITKISEQAIMKKNTANVCTYCGKQEIRNTYMIKHKL